MFDDIGPVTQHAELADSQKNKQTDPELEKEAASDYGIATDLGMSV